MSSVRKVVYLFGAGSTNAEIANLHPTWFSDQTSISKRSLLLKEVSLRVCKAARDYGWFRKWKQSGEIADLELFLSLIKNNGLDSDAVTKGLEKLMEEDICSRLGDGTIRKFYLHKALFELHQVTESKEKLLNVISLNYDKVLDDAYEVVYKNKPNYALTLEDSDGGPYLLKLHGGFELKNTKTGKRIQIIPPGTQKNYLQFPYNFIWGRALDSLMDCDVLRVVGCSLSTNDIGLIDLLFKAEKERGKRPMEIQLINSNDSGRKVKKKFGFFPKVKTLYEIEEPPSKAPLVAKLIDNNAFKTWITAKANASLSASEIKKTRYIKKLF